MTQVKEASFAPKDFVAGGLIGDIDVEIESACFTDEPPPEYGESALFLRADLKDLATGEVYTQYWSAGKKALDSFNISADGYRAIPKSGEARFIRGSKFHTFVQSLVDAGFPEGKCNSLSNLLRLQMHVIQKADEARPGMRQREEDRDRPRTTLICERILKMPGEKSKPAAKKVASPAAPAAGEENGEAENQDLSAVAVEKLTAVISAGPAEGTKIHTARAKVFQQAQKLGAEDRTAILKMVSDPEWLAENGFAYDDSTKLISIPA